MKRNGSPVPSSAPHSFGGVGGLAVAMLVASAGLAHAAARPSVSGRLLAPGGRNTYYVSQRIQHGRIYLRVRWPGEDLATLLVRGSIPYANTEVRIDGRRIQVKAENVIKFNLGELPYGEYTARMAVVQRETNRFAGQIATRFRKLPYQANEVCLSPDGWVLADREPGLPLVAKLATMPKSLAPVAAAGFDVAALPTDLPPAGMWQSGVRLLLSQGADSGKAIAQANREASTFGWLAAKPATKPEFLRFVEQRAYHPLVTRVLASGINRQFFSDIISIAADAPGKGKPFALNRWADAIAAMAKRQRCAWAEIPAGLSAPAMRMAAYLALTSRAKALVMPAPAALDKAKDWRAFTELVGELSKTREVFLQGTLPAALGVKPAGQVRAASVVHRGRTFLFICNPTTQAQKAAVTVASLEPGRTLWTLGGKRTVSLDANRGLAETLDPMSAHVYTTRPGG